MPKGIRKIPLTIRHCSVEGCDSKHRSNGYCQYHFGNWYRRGDPISKGVLGSNGTHHKTGTPEWIAWSSMKQRCGLPSRADFCHYGGRGIRVCARWQRSFENFLADMGKRPSTRHSLDRINNNGNYTPKNCRWATPFEQHNNRSDNTRIVHDGVSLTLSEWSLRLNRNRSTISRRLKSGWTVADALFKPLKFSQAECFARKRAA